MTEFKQMREKSTPGHAPHVPLLEKICGMIEPKPIVKPVAPQFLRLSLATIFLLFALGVRADVSLATLYSFTGTNDGAYPDAGLVQGSDGYFYGTTVSGGANNYGTVFKLSANGALTSLYSFTGSKDGTEPLGSLVEGSDGCFYGTTCGYDGPSGATNGAVFKISTNGVLACLYSFAGSNDGSEPYAGLVQGNDGCFYGTTQNGGTNGNGTVFKINTMGALTGLYSFTGLNDDGAHPIAGLVQGGDGCFYGTTFSGGTNGAGTVFKINTNGVITHLYFFTNRKDGGYPCGGLAQGADGYYFGTTHSGGTNYHGTVYSINSTGALTSLYSFSGGDDGGYPYAGLVQGSDGNFYGTTTYGGTSGNGTLFKISAAGVATSLYSFAGGKDGSVPYAGLVEGTDGDYYGTTHGGGAAGYGTVFRLTVRPVPPVLTGATLSNSTLLLTWSAETGVSYQLQYICGLNSTNWINLGSVLTATGATLSTTDSVTNSPCRYYRVMLLP
jgi:uncharacterized repeat protein (TIGR03803 family)